MNRLIIAALSKEKGLPPYQLLLFGQQEELENDEEVQNSKSREPRL